MPSMKAAIDIGIASTGIRARVPSDKSTGEVGTATVPMLTGSRWNRRRVFVQCMAALP